MINFSIHRQVIITLGSLIVEGLGYFYKISSPYLRCYVNKYKLKGHFISIGIFLISMMFLSCDQIENSIDALDSALIDSLMSDYDLINGPGAALVITENGNIIYSRGYGLANLEENIPIISETNFRLASVTKQFTAMCIMILESYEQLSYEQSLTDLFQNFPDYGNDITIRHLLHHTSGLRDYFSLIPNNATQQIHDDDVLNMMREQTTTYFTSGSEYRYSNSGYAVLAMIVEQVSGMSFANFLSENIFIPMNMTGSIAFEDGISMVTSRAYGYSYSGDNYVMNDQSLTSAVLGDGGIYTSIDDLIKWDQGLYTNSILPQDILQEAFTSGTLSNGLETGYGFGWVLDTYKNRTRVGHTGSTRGFRNVYHRYPDEQLSIIILTNRNSGSPKDIANQIAAILFGG